MESILRELASVRSFEGEGSRWLDYSRLLQELSDEGSPQAVEALLGFFDDPDFEFSHRASVFAEVLSNIEDPRVGELASKQLQEKALLGELSAYDAGGYIELVATHHGREGAQLLVGMLREGKGAISGPLAEQVVHFGGQGLTQELIEVMKSRRVPEDIILEGMMSWEQPGVSEQIKQLSEDHEAPLRLRKESLAVYCRSATKNQLLDVATGYWYAQSVDEKLVALYGMRGIGKRGDEDLGEVVDTYTPSILDALGADNSALRQEALWLVNGTSSLGSASVVRGLESMLQRQDLSDSQRALARQLISRHK